jgi:hypothetical protein
MRKRGSFKSEEDWKGEKIGQERFRKGRRLKKELG